MMELVTTPKNMAPDDAIAWFKKQPNVEYAEPNYRVTASVVSNDTYYLNSSLWGMYSDDSPSAVGPAGTTNTFGSGAEKAWNAGYIGSSNVFVGIIDTGVQVSHPDIAANMWVNPYDPLDGVDNDGNGFVDDTNGWDFYNTDRTVFDDPTSDDHGTHVAGTIGGIGGNAQGVAGVNWNVTMISCKFLGYNGGTTADAVRALDYLTDLKTRHGLNLVATNNSWGGGGYSSALHAAVNRSAKSNILFVAAAGNSSSNNDYTMNYPSSLSTLQNATGEPAASYEGVIAVASLDSNGAMSYFSSFGPTTVDIAAPGGGIWSSIPTNSYANFSGTSMATPHVTGAVALFKSVYPNATAQQIRNAILQSATPTASQAGYTVTGGRLNVFAAITNGVTAPPPTVTIGDVSQNEGNSGTANMVFTVSMSSALNSAVTFNYATSNGTATAGSDYVATTGSATIPAGSTSVTIAVPVNGDTTVETDETFTLTLSALSSNAVFTDNAAVGTIKNDDVPPPTISVADRSQNEGNSGTANMVFTVTLSAVTAAPVTFGYATANGTATAGSDYVAATGTATIPAGSTSVTIPVVINGDTTVETDETFTLNLSNISSNATFARATATGTIKNDDVPPPTVSVADVSRTEGNSGTSNMVFTVSISAATTAPVTFTYATADGTATAGSDYVAATGTATIPAGSTSVAVNVSINGDTTIENDETLTLNLSNLSANATFARATATGTIVNDDFPPSISVADVSLNEGNSGTSNMVFTVVLSAAQALPVTFSYATANGTATAGSDYVAATGTATIPAGSTSVAIPVVINGDTTIEPNETLTLTLSNISSNAVISRATATGTIVNDDIPPLGVSVADVSRLEGNSGSANLVFTVRLSAATTSTVSFSFATSDVTATAGSDYASRSGTASILAGRTSVSISVPVYGDTTFEPDETFKLTLSNLSSNAQFTRAEAIGTIRNDDAPPPVLASINDIQVTEGNDGVANAVFTVSLDKAALVPVSVDFYTYGLTATPGYDYQAQFGTLTIPAGATSGTITVPVYGDVEVESNETFELNIYNATGGAAIADGTGIGTIINDDAFSRLSVADIRVAEGNSGTTMANFTVNLDQPNNGDISLWYYTYDMSASSYLDYEPPFAQLTIPAGATSGTISIPIYGDTQVEPDETFQLWMYGVSSNAILDNSSA
ncbi:MAG: Calx-beta domain-containing protein, partial [Planctomycetota bacterium]